MILYQDIEEAFSTQKVLDTKPSEIKAMLKKMITEYAVRIGQANIKEAFIMATCELMQVDLSKYYRHLFTGEVSLAIKLLSFGEFGDRRHVSVDTFMTAINQFLVSRERADFKEKKAKQDNEGKLLLEVKNQWSESEFIEAMRKRYQENMQLVREGKQVRDIGGLLFYHMKSLGFVDLFPEDVQEVYDELVEKKKHDKLDTYVRSLIIDHNKGEKVLIPFAQAKVLYKYFAMQIEARKIKNT